MDPEQQARCLLAPTPEQLTSVKVFPLIHSLKREVTNTIDSALSWEQLTAADINFSIVRPIVNKYARLRNLSVAYACLVVRSYFLMDAETNLAFAGVMLTRANLCEILAIKLLRRFATNYIELVAVLTTTWNPLAGATHDVVNQVKQTLNAHDDDIAYGQSAIEIAISTRAKAFLVSPVAQQVVNDIYSGRVVYSVAAYRSILADNYKPRAIEIYDPLNAPFLNHYRLRVPKYSAYFEFVNFGLLLFTYILCLSNRDRTQITTWEMTFIIFGSAFALEEYTSSTEQGWIIYIANMWNAFDFSFIVVFIGYLTLRIKGLGNDDPATSDMAFDVLSCGACILFPRYINFYLHPLVENPVEEKAPRLAFFAVSNNVVVLSLRAMISQFVFFIGIAATCFSGLLFTLWTLAGDNPARHRQWTVKAIAWLMVQIWFGNTSLSFAEATSFHPIFGPILMTCFAALSNTLLLTILISILSNTVANINMNATQEYLFQFTISTVEGVKTNALFSYQPPFNILAFLILKPASWFFTPRRLHTINVFLIKLTSLPQLILISLYERYSASGKRLRTSGKDPAQSFFNRLPRHIKNMPLMEALRGSASNDLFEAIFDIELDETDELFLDESDGEDVAALRSLRSRENFRVGYDDRRGSSMSPPRIQTRGFSSPRSTSPHTGERGGDPGLNFVFPVDVSEGPPPSINQSPLSRLFRSRLLSTPGIIQSAASSEFAVAAAQAATRAAMNTETSARHIETLLETVSELPVHKLKEEMKELQDRQARIENLLLMLTRGMRNETHRQGTAS